MKNSSFSERLRDAMKIRNMRQIDLAKKTGLDKSLIWNYLHNKYEARQDILSTLADALGVSEVWLMGYDVPINEFETQEITKEEFISELTSLLSNTDLDEDKKKYIRKTIKMIVEDED